MMGGETNNIVIASWGNPTGWKKVTYIYNNCQKFTFSSTFALTFCLNIDYNNVVIFLPCSLAADDRIYHIFNNKNIDFNTIKKEIINWISDFINKRDGDNKEVPQLIVVPSIGSFQKIKFESNAESYLTSIYYHILDILRRKYNNGKDIHIHLDITHGINYMPLMCKEAVELAANTFAVITGKKVQVTVYNSDPLSPLPQNDDQNIQLNINKIYEITYDGYKSMEQLLLKFVLDYNINKNEYMNRLRYVDMSREDLEDLNRLSKAVSSGILLVLPYKDYLIKCNKEKLERLLERISKEARIINNSVIEYLKSSYRIALLHAVLTALDSIKLDVYKEDDWVGVSLESLEKNSEKYYEKTLDSIYSIVAQEIKYLKDEIDKYYNWLDNLKTILNIQNISTNDYQLYGRIKYKTEFDKSKEGRTNRRLLYAHAGLEENVTYIKKVDNQIFVSYGKYFDKVFEEVSRHL